MTNYSVKNVDEFIAASPQEAQPHLREIRKLVRAAVPEADEQIGYGKPYYKHHKWVAGFDVYKSHIGFEIWDGLSSEDREQLEEAGYKTGSTSFQVRYDQKVPAAIITRLVKAQARLNEEKVKNK